MRLNNSCLKLALAALMILLPGIAWGNSDTYKAVLNVTATSGEGKVYVNHDSSTAPSDRDYGTSKSDSASKDSDSSPQSFTFYAYYKADLGYTFEKWTSDSNATIGTDNKTVTMSVSSRNTTKPSGESADYYKSATITANFILEEYEIEYKSQDGTTNMPQTGSYYITTQSIKISETEPKLTGYTFSGWKASYSDTSGGAGWDTSTPYKPRATITNNNKNVYGNVTLTAQWNPIPYTIVYRSTETCENLPEEQGYDIETTPIVLSSNVPIKEGWTFTGWTASFTNDTGSGWTQNPYQAGASITNNKDHYGNVTLTAGWEKEPDPSSIKVSITGLKGDDHAIFNITYEKQGQTVKQQIAIHESAIVKIPGGVSSVTVMPSKWTEKTYTITPPGETTQDVEVGKTALFNFSATPKSGHNIFETSREF